MASLHSKLTIAAVGAAASVAAGIGISQAMAASPSPSPSSSASPGSGAASANSGGSEGPGGSAYGMGGRMGHHGDRGEGMGGFGMGRGADLSTLATKLGVDQAKLTAALQKVGQSLHDQDNGQHDGTPPTDAERTARLDAFATALAKELGIDKAKVTAALNALEADRQAARTAELTARLDAAVKAGTLTEADKASVLKAFAAGVLGGPGRG